MAQRGPRVHAFKNVRDVPDEAALGEAVPERLEGSWGTVHGELDPAGFVLEQDGQPAHKAVDVVTGSKPRRQCQKPGHAKRPGRATLTHEMA